MTANEKRQAVIDKYRTILDRNIYSQPRRDYCFRKYTDGKYYSDCSSSVSYAYKEAGLGFGILNTVGMYQSPKLKAVPVKISGGQIQNPEVLRIGDMLLFAGTDKGRAYAGYVGHVEMVYSISGSNVTICGHGSGSPSLKKMDTYLRSRYYAKTSTAVGNKGLIKVVRFIQDDDDTATAPIVAPVTPIKPILSSAVRIIGGAVNIRKGAGTNFGVYKVARKGNVFERADVEDWKYVRFGSKVGWISAKYVSTNGLCTGGSVNIRKGAGTNFEPVGIARKGQKLDLINTNGWVPIVIDKAIYWVSEKYVG